MYISNKSHLDHSLNEKHLMLLLKTFGDHEGFAIKELELPEGMELPSGLYGPAAGDDPVPEDSVSYASRNGRPTRSRLIDKPSRPSKTATVIMGPDSRGQTVLYTVYGGPPAPREPGDTSIATDEERKESDDFWAVHALVKNS